MTTATLTKPETKPAETAPKTNRSGLTDEQLDAFGAELDAIRARVLADRGERDADYIRNVIKAQRALEVAGRGLFFFSFLPPAWLGGVTALSLSKILDNMEIGHNVMHGQYDWMKDPELTSKGFEWDTACPGDQWRHSHNYMHHTHTNIVGKDRDIGYGILRMSEDEPWRPYYLGNPLYALLLATFFQYGVALHDLEVERIQSGETTFAEKREMAQSIWAKVKQQSLKDYVLFPLLTGPVRAADAGRQRGREPEPQPVVVHDHLLRPLPGRDAGVLRAGDRERDARRVVSPPAARLGEPDRKQAVPHHVRQPLAPDRAPPVPRSAGAPLRRDLGRGPGDLRALRAPVQQRPADEAVRQRRQEDLPARAPVVALAGAAGGRGGDLN